MPWVPERHASRAERVIVTGAHDAGAIGRGIPFTVGPIPLQDSEEVLKEGPASVLGRTPGVPTLMDRLLLPLSGGRPVHHGRLYLTQWRLVFLPTGHHAQIFAFDIAIAYVAEVGADRRLVRDVLHLALRNGREYELAVRRAADWASTIAHVAGLDSASSHRPQ
jgi:hypothetical protein